MKRAAQKVRPETRGFILRCRDERDNQGAATKAQVLHGGDKKRHRVFPGDISGSQMKGKQGPSLTGSELN